MAIGNNNCWYYRPFNVKLIIALINYSLNPSPRALRVLATFSFPRKKLSPEKFYRHPPPSEGNTINIQLRKRRKKNQTSSSTTFQLSQGKSNYLKASTNIYVELSIKSAVGTAFALQKNTPNWKAARQQAKSIGNMQRKITNKQKFKSWKIESWKSQNHRGSQATLGLATYCSTLFKNLIFFKGGIRRLARGGHLRIVRGQFGWFARKLGIKVTGNVLVAPVERRNVGWGDLFLGQLARGDGFQCIFFFVELKRQLQGFFFVFVQLAGRN